MTVKSFLVYMVTIMNRIMICFFVLFAFFFFLGGICSNYNKYNKQNEFLYIYIYIYIYIYMYTVEQSVCMQSIISHYLYKR